MTLAVLSAFLLGAPILLSVLLGAAPRHLAALMHPALAVRALAVTAFVAALTTGFGLAVLALMLLARASDIARIGHWSPSALAVPRSVPWVVGLPVAAAVVLLLLSAATHATRAGHQLWLAESFCRNLGPDDGAPVVVDDHEPQAFAVAGLRGRVVLSTAMVAALSPAERGGLIAHECAHLQHRHHLWIQLAEVAATANPLLRNVPGAVRLAAERWADEDAAAQVGDRRLVAEAIGHAALAQARTRRTPTLTGRLAATGGDVPHRVRALLSKPRLRWSGVVVLSLAVATTGALVLSGVSARMTERNFERAQQRPHPAARAASTSLAPQRVPAAFHGTCPRPIPGALYHTPPTFRRTVALTFDDGPSIYTARVLHILSRAHVHATFFVVGDRAQADAAVLRQMVRDGDLVGNHTYTHPDRPGSLDHLPLAAQEAQIDKATAVIVRATGVRPCFLRAPQGMDYSALTQRLASERDLLLTHWSNTSSDFAQPGGLDPAWVRRIVAGATHPLSAHAIVLLHDGGNATTRQRLDTLAALPRIIAYYAVRGYVFTDPAGRRFNPT